MRDSFFIHDRCELQFAVKELARRMQPAVECQEHAGAQAVVAIFERKSEVFGRLWSTS